jgi:Stigma-specific protein, Stig1
MAAVAGAFGGRSVARAQSDDENEPTPCEWTLRALVVSGPNEDTTYEGALRVAIERDGAIDDGSLESEEQEPYDVVGNTRGKAISLVIKLSDELSLHLTGAGSRDIKSCEGQIAGTFAGPEFGDIGVWMVTRTSNGDDDTVLFPTPTAGSGSNPGDPSPTPGSTTPCPPEDCGVTKLWDPQQCKCVCYDNGVDCGPNTCCPQGAICEAGGGCSCPPGTILCGNACVSECGGGQVLDYNTCSCSNDCPSGQVKCNGQCIGQCGSGETLNTTTCDCEGVCPAGQDFCNGACTDVVNDESNCGSCGNVCPPGMPCIAGTCTCPATMKYCASTDVCIDENATCP